MQGISITGRKANEDKYDFYETPTWATEKIVEKLLIDGVINKYDNVHLIKSKDSYHTKSDVNFHNIKLNSTYESKCVPYLQDGDLFYIVAT